MREDPDDKFLKVERGIIRALCRIVVAIAQTQPHVRSTPMASGSLLDILRRIATDLALALILQLALRAVDRSNSRSKNITPQR